MASTESNHAFRQIQAPHYQFELSQSSKALCVCSKHIPSGLVRLPRNEPGTLDRATPGLWSKSVVSLYSQPRLIYESIPASEQMGVWGKGEEHSQALINPDTRPHNGRTPALQAELKKFYNGSLEKNISKGMRKLLRHA
jgi:hypothetical protein